MGANTQAVYAYCKDRSRFRVWAVKGMAGQAKPVWPKKASRGRGKVNVFIVGVDTAKDSIYARLKLTEPGPGYCHFPLNRDRSWYEQLTAETVMTRYVKGFPTRVWQKKPSVRNEALDCRVYAYAALCSLNVQWTRELRHAEAAPRIELVEPTADEPAADSIPVRVPPPVVTGQRKPLFARRSARTF